MDGDETDPQIGGRQHHDRAARPFERRGRGQFGDEFGVAREPKSGLVERGLGDGGGDDTRREAPEGEVHRLFDPGHDRRRMRGVGPARLDRHRDRPMQNRQGAFEYGPGLERIVDSRDGDTIALDQVGITDDQEHRAGLTQPLPGRAHDFRPDPGRIAQAQGERRGHHRWVQDSLPRDSIVAALRRSRM
jgi:hypothetical protein